MVSVRYMPVLRSKRAEIHAIADVRPDRRQLLYPLVQLVDPEDSKKAPAKRMQELVMSEKNGLVGCFGPSEPCLLDFRSLHDGLLDSSAHPAEWFLDLCASTGVSPVPVVGRDCQTSYIDAVGRSLRRLGTGASIRLRGDDIIGGAQGVATLLRRLDVPRSEIDLVLDIERLPLGRTAIVAELLHRGLEQLNPLVDWRSVAICGGVFPEELTNEVDHDSHGVIARTELDLWKRVSSRAGLGVVDFGDYSVVAPENPGGGGRSGAANIRFAREKDWLIVRGHRLIDHKPDPFDYLFQAERLMSMVASFDSTHCAGCDFISTRTSGSPGNPGQWRGAGFSHHLAITIDQLGNIARDPSTDPGT